MPLVSIQIASRTYELACGEGEEARVQELAAYVDEKVCELRLQLPPGAPEVKLLVFAALMLADEVSEAEAHKRGAATVLPDEQLGTAGEVLAGQGLDARRARPTDVGRGGIVDHRDAAADVEQAATQVGLLGVQPEPGVEASHLLEAGATDNGVFSCFP